MIIMQIDPLSTVGMAELTKTIGFPIATFIIMVSILIYVIKTDETRQEKSDIRYEKLVNQFVETTKQITDKQNDAMARMTDQIRDITQELKIVTTKLDENMRLKSQYNRLQNERYH